MISLSCYDTCQCFGDSGIIGPTMFIVCVSVFLSHPCTLLNNNNYNIEAFEELDHCARFKK
jgi:hypothetical protein